MTVLQREGADAVEIGLARCATANGERHTRGPNVDEDLRTEPEGLDAVSAREVAEAGCQVAPESTLHAARVGDAIGRRHDLVGQPDGLGGLDDRTHEGVAL